MIPITILATVNEPVLHHRLSVHIPADESTIAQVAAAAQQISPLKFYPDLTLTSPPSSQRFSAMALDGDLHLEWQTPQGQQSELVEDLLLRLDRLEATQAVFNSYKGAIRDVVIPNSDNLAIRCLLDVFLLEQGYSSLCGSRAAWIEEHKSTISIITGIPEGDVPTFFQ
jgi:hypothetical protein